jgi:hypothetical protein
MIRYLAGLAALSVVTLQGCATLNSPEAHANAAAQRQECKMVAYYSASEALRVQNEKGIPGSEMEKTEGKLDIGRLTLNEPRALGDNPPGMSMTDRIQRTC